MKRNKFKKAYLGIREGIRIENSFKVHLTAAALAIVISALLRLNSTEWCLVLLVIGLVLVAEMFNTGIELLVRLHTREYHKLAEKLLNISAGAVLISSIVATLIGLIIFGCKIIALYKDL